MKVDGAPGNNCHNANSCVAGMLRTTSYYICAGDSITFAFKANSGKDWFESGIGLYKGEVPGSGTLVDVKFIRGHMIHDYINDKFTIYQGGHYYLTFYSGTFDRTGGTVLGAKMWMKVFMAEGVCTTCSVKAADVCNKFCGRDDCNCFDHWGQKYVDQCPDTSCAGCEQCLCSDRPADKIAPLNAPCAQNLFAATDTACDDDCPPNAPVDEL
jgi:hypothetical protein